MDTPNVNNLNGIPNFGYGLPADGAVIAGVTDNQTYVQEADQSAQSDAGVQTAEAPLGQQNGTQSEEPQTGDSDSAQSDAQTLT